METNGSEHSSPSSSDRIRKLLTRWLSFFMPQVASASKDEAVPVVVLTDEKNQPPKRTDFESDQDCACE